MKVFSNRVEKVCLLEFLGPRCIVQPLPIHKNAYFRYDRITRISTIISTGVINENPTRSNLATFVALDEQELQGAFGDPGLDDRIELMYERLVFDGTREHSARWRQVWQSYRR